VGLKELMYKKKTLSEADKLKEAIQQVDTWLMSHAPTYELHFDTSVPLNPARASYLTTGAIIQKYKSYEEKLEEFIGEHLYGVGDMYDLYEIYQWVELCLTTIFQMVIFAPSSSIRHVTNFNEAVSYFNNVFLRTEGLCKTISHNMWEIQREARGLYIIDGREAMHDEDFILYEDGVKKVRNRGELEQCQSLFMMLAECMDYGRYLMDIMLHIYENVPYAVDREGRYMRIVDWKKTQENINRHINIENRRHRFTTGDDFIALIE